MAELKLPFFGHGGDYNPDQWRHIPGTLDEDIRLMKLAGCNLMSVGIFSWAALEPEEGVYDFDWLQEVLDRFAENGISAFLATPSGARPQWMSQKYPEVLRVDQNGVRHIHGVRHNHCFTSPVYRDFVRKINTALAERFGRHPAVVGWHISNEYSGECHCELCQAAFREYLKDTYKTLDNLNQQWWTGFWANTVTDWEQLHSPMPIGETHVHGLNLSWKRFVTKQTVDFMNAETEPLRRITPHLPVTTNMMLFYTGIDYFRFGDALDFASFDCYPAWGVETESDEMEAVRASFNYDMMRCLLGKPFALMESTPSQVNWQEICKLKKPGMHFLSSMHAVAHGADTVQYFQWRKSRGSWEKFHGAVVDHVGNENTRTFRDVAEVGEALKKLTGVLGSGTKSDAALIYDVENHWALDNSQGPRRDKHYKSTLTQHYLALKRQGVNVDIVDQSYAFDGYKVLVAPLMYMVRPGVAERIEAFVENGGTFVATVRTGCVDQDDLCFLTGFPGPLRKVLGVWAEECDGLCDGETNALRLPCGTTYTVSDMCDLIHAETAKVVAEYSEDFYAGMPAVTVNDFGAGHAWYIASRPEQAFLDGFYQKLLADAGIESLIANLPVGVQAVTREGENGKFLFVMNFTRRPAQAELPCGVDALTGEAVGGCTELPVNGIRIVKCQEDA